MSNIDGLHLVATQQTPPSEAVHHMMRMLVDNLRQKIKRLYVNGDNYSQPNGVGLHKVLADDATRVIVHKDQQYHHV